MVAALERLLCQRFWAIHDGVETLFKTFLVSLLKFSVMRIEMLSSLYYNFCWKYDGAVMW